MGIIGSLEPSDMIGLGALITAFFSIILTVVIAFSNVRPLVTTILSTKNDDNRYILIKNFGLGTAIIKKIYFEQISGGKKTSDLFKLVRVPGAACQEYWVFSQKKYYIGPQDKIYVLLMTPEYLKDNKDYDFDDLSEKLAEDMKNLKVVIKYRSVFGMGKTYKRIFAKDRSDYYDGEVEI